MGVPHQDSDPDSDLHVKRHIAAERPQMFRSDSDMEEFLQSRKDMSKVYSDLRKYMSMLYTYYNKYNNVLKDPNFENYDPNTARDMSRIFELRSKLRQFLEVNTFTERDEIAESILDDISGIFFWKNHTAHSFGFNVLTSDGINKTGKYALFTYEGIEYKILEVLQHISDTISEVPMVGEGELPATGKGVQGDGLNALLWQLHTLHTSM